MHPPPGVPEGPGRPTLPAAASSSSSSRRRVRVDSFPSANPAPEAKRARSGEAVSPGAPAAGSSGSSRMAAAAAAAAAGAYAVGKGKQPETIDLTRQPTAPGSAFQPHNGARRLVIKNLRPASSARAADEERYYERTWAELQAGLRAMFASRPPAQPFERLCRGVQDVCLNGQAEKLFLTLGGMCESHLNGHVLGTILAEAKGLGEVDVLRIVLRQWSTWFKQSVSLAPDWPSLSKIGGSNRG